MAKELTNLLDLSSGAIQEKINYELKKVMKNIADSNTSAIGKRRIQITIDLTPKDDERREISVTFGVKTTLAPIKSGESRLYLTQSPSGRLGLFENNSEQLEFDFAEDETKSNKILKID
jgi:hypothetical protein